MNRAEGQPIPTTEISTNGRVVPLAGAASRGGDVEKVDDALDDLVATVDHLVRDLATDRATPRRAAGLGAGGPTREWLVVASRRLRPARSTKELVAGRALLIAALVVVVAIEFVLIGFVLSHL